MKGAKAVTELIKRLREEKIMLVEVYNIKKAETRVLTKKWHLYDFPLLLIIDTEHKPEKRRSKKKDISTGWIDERRIIFHADLIKDHPDYVWERLKKASHGIFTWDGT